MKLGDRKTRRMMDRMGINMKEIADVEEVIIRTSSKEIHITRRPGLRGQRPGEPHIPGHGRGGGGREGEEEVL